MLCNSWESQSQIDMDTDQYPSLLCPCHCHCCLVQTGWTSSHTTRLSTLFRANSFRGPIWGNGDIPQLDRSPELSTYDNWLQGYVKSKFFVTRPKNIAVCHKTKLLHFHNIVTTHNGKSGNQIKMCVRNGQRHLSDIIFYKLKCHQNVIVTVVFST